MFSFYAYTVFMLSWNVYRKHICFQRIMVLGPSFCEVDKPNSIIFQGSSINKNKNTNILRKVPDFTVQLSWLNVPFFWYEFMPTKTPVLQRSLFRHLSTSKQHSSHVSEVMASFFYVKYCALFCLIWNTLFTVYE